jgi:hypothetical protein
MDEATGTVLNNAPVVSNAVKKLVAAVNCGA